MATNPWRWRFYQMQNGTANYTSESYMFDLPLESAQFTSKLNGVGTAQGSLLMSDPTVQKRLLGAATWDQLCGKTAMYADYNGALVWGGILQTAKYQNSTRTVQLGFQDWAQYLSQRLISWAATYTTTDEATIAAGIVTTALAVTGGNVGITVAGAPATGVNVTQAYAPTDFKPVLQAINELAQHAVGFDWSVDVAYAAGVPTKTFNIWYPRQGRTQQAQEAAGSAVTFNYGGQGVDYIWPSDSSAQAQTTFGAGSGTSQSAVTAQASDANVLSAGWPLTEDSISRTDILDQNLLNYVTTAFNNAVKYPITLPELTMRVDGDQPLGSFSMGDDCRIIIPPDPYFQIGYDSALAPGIWWRIQQTDVTVKDDGLSTMHLVFGRPPYIPGT